MRRTNCLNRLRLERVATRRSSTLAFTCNYVHTRLSQQLVLVSASPLWLRMISLETDETHSNGRSFCFLPCRAHSSSPSSSIRIRAPFLNSDPAAPTHAADQQTTESERILSSFLPSASAAMSRSQQQTFTPALTALLQQSQQQQAQPLYEGTRLSSHQADPAPILSPYRSKQQLKGLGRQQPEALNRKSAKGTFEIETSTETSAQ